MPDPDYEYITELEQFILTHALSDFVRREQVKWRDNANDAATFSWQLMDRSITLGEKLLADIQSDFIVRRKGPPLFTSR
jgi:hypothetical protein